MLSGMLAGGDEMSKILPKAYQRRQTCVYTRPTTIYFALHGVLTTFSDHLTIDAALLDELPLESNNSAVRSLILNPVLQGKGFAWRVDPHYRPFGKES